MSILLRRAKREYRHEHRSLIGRPVRVADTMVHTQLVGGSPVKPIKAGWKKWFSYAKKAHSVVKGPEVDSADVTTAFLVHQLGMVAAENIAVDAQDTTNSEEISDGQASETATFPQNNEDSPEGLEVEDSVAPDTTDILESLRFLFAAPSETMAASQQERIRDSMDSDGSTWNTRSGSPSSDVDTAASTPPSTYGKRKSMCETPIDVPIFRVYHDGRNRLMSSDIDITVVKEQDQVFEKQTSTGVLEVDHAQEAAPTHEMVQTGDSVQNLERDVSSPPTNAAAPPTAIAASSVESAHVSVTLDTKEVEAASSVQICKRRAGNTGRRRRKTAESSIDGHKKSLCNLQRIIIRRTHTHAADKLKMQQEFAQLQEANMLLERRNTNLGNTNFQQHKAYALLNDRLLELEDQNRNEDPRTISELNKLVQLLKEKVSQLEDSKMQMVMKVTREYDDYKQGQKGKVEALQAKIDRTQEELAYAVEARDAFEQQLSDALALQNPTGEQTASAFEAKEKILKQENENSVRLLQEETKKRKESEQLATDLRLRCRKTERDLKEAQETITTLTSANKLLEARAEPIDFLGLPPQQRNEMAQMQRVVADLTEELRLAKELLNKVSKAKLGQVQSIILEDRDHHYQMYISRIEEQSDRITDLTNKLSILEHAMRHDQGLAFGVQEENED